MSNTPSAIPSIHVPLGRNLRTRTTTRTLPPGDGLAAPSWRNDTDTPSRARSDGLEAVETKVAAEAEVETTLGEVMPVMAETSEEVAEEIELGPVPWPMC